MSYSVKGILKRVGNIETVGTNNFTKRTFVIETKEQYPQTLEFQLTKDRVDIVDVYHIGEEMEIHFNLRGRDWTNPQGEIKTFNTLECWKLVKVAGQTQQDAQVEENEAAMNEMDMINDFNRVTQSGKDDLPF
jgi:hypothetical protein